SGLGLLTKATSSVLWITAAVCLARWVATLWPRTRLRELWRRLLAPALAASLVLCLTVGWWCVPNLRKYHHPFPHDWDLDARAQANPTATPILYRRPLGWFLPFELSYYDFPIIRSPSEPRPNFWGV